jgi:hypothetical protein
MGSANRNTDKCILDEAVHFLRREHKANNMKTINKFRLFFSLAFTETISTFVFV